MKKDFTQVPYKDIDQQVSNPRLQTGPILPKKQPHEEWYRYAALCLILLTDHYQTIYCFHCPVRQCIWISGETWLPGVSFCSDEMAQHSRILSATHNGNGFSQYSGPVF